jgi:succinate dehydrogenase / fumarate reductase membrane anchor subunit
MSKKDWARREPPVGGTEFEMKAWLFMRISGLLLILLAVGHMFIMHIFNDTLNLDYEFVAKRWDDYTIRAFDWLLLALSLLHGGNGVRIVLHDNISNPTIKRISILSLFAITFIFFLLGSYGLFTFVSQI